MNIRPIKSDQDHDEAVARITYLMDAAEGSDEEMELEILSILVDAYESARFPIEAPNPIDAIKFRMDQLGLERKDLEPIFGTRARTSEILNGVRPLSIDMIRKLHRVYDIPLESLIGDASVASSSHGNRA